MDSSIQMISSRYALGFVLAMTSAACSSPQPSQETTSATTPAPAPAAVAPPSVGVYVTNESSGDLSVIDAATHAVVATIPLGKRPRGIAVSPDKTTLYVALSGSPAAPPGVDWRVVMTWPVVLNVVLFMLFFAFAVGVQNYGIVALAAVQGIVNAFDMPARQSLLVEMVDNREDLPNAIALNSSMVNAARLVGPALAGILISAVGERMSLNLCRSARSCCCSGWSAWLECRIRCSCQSSHRKCCTGVPIRWEFLWPRRDLAL